MKTIRLLPCLLLIMSTNALWAQDATPAVSVRLEVDRDRIYQYETFALSITMVSRGVRLGKNITLEGMPDPDRLAMDPIEARPIERRMEGRSIVETRRYRARCRALVPGDLTLNPAAGTAQIVRRRSFFGRQWVEKPIRLPVEPLTIPIAALPDPPSGVTFSGAVGTLTYSVTPASLNVAVGDLIRLHTRIAGDGYIEGVRCPAARPGPSFKLYPPRLTDRRANAVEFEQILIPLNDTATRVPALTLTTFDARGGHYQTQTQGPFRITLHAPRKSEIAQPYRHAADTNRPAQPLTLADKIDEWKQQAPPDDAEEVIVIQRVVARLAPTPTARALFDCQPGDVVTVTEAAADWITIRRGNNRGWIPNDTVMRR